MSWRRPVRKFVDAVRERFSDPVGAEERIALTGFFREDEICWVADTYTSGGTAGETWQQVLRDAHLALPEWYEPGLDPFGASYARQQHRLWQLVAGIDRGYRADIDEREHAWGDVDAVRRPGYFMRRDSEAVRAAADHVLATGMLLKHCGLRPGEFALEYGAGFAQTALTLARLGVTVDTVDISPVFCRFVREQAEFFQVPLTPFEGRFGENPRPGRKYHAIWFYESFHHCVDFLSVVSGLGDLLEPGGRVLLGGEPIVEQEYAAVPFPWGLRLHSEVVAVVRRHGWFELGFSEDFLFELFTNAGFTARRVDCEPSPFGRLYIFELRAEVVELATQWLPAGYASGWHDAEAGGRRTKGSGRLPVDARAGYSAIELQVSNPHEVSCRLTAEYGDRRREIAIEPGKDATVTLDASPGARTLTVSAAGSPSAWRRRAKEAVGGIIVRRLRYVP